ncbi:hypothetical protein [Mucilaginibacter flavus]|uniref:hypothetical protein n=1 Tax=Mucilaginibacter flavus TaxID=931504 RepID=UPI0025B4D404|nr:hypothetical protein [Mucilaginibacter flavus]MDN3582179.1 hypothetical protein [Mucilaginibacter flavus]
MKNNKIKTLVGIGLLFLLSILSSFNHKMGPEYDVAALYQGKNLNDAKIITDDGLKDADVVLFPLKLQTGKYIVNVTKKGKDIYKVDGKDIYIETKYCYEYATGEEAVLTIESSYGYTIGKIKF